MIIKSAHSISLPFAAEAQNFTEPLVHRPKFKDFVRAPQHLQCGQQQLGWRVEEACGDTQKWPLI
jgi:hypothetical protein